jgi:hypothetical protein
VLIAVHPLSKGKGEVILQENHYRGHWKEVERIASLFEHYLEEDCLKAMEICVKYNCFAARFVQGYLGQHADKKTEPVIQRLMWDERKLVQSGTAVKRDLKEYRL